MKKAQMKICSLVLAVSLFTGCSAMNTAGGTQVANRGTVSGSVAAEAGSRELSGESRSYRKNSDNWYDVSDEEDGMLLQYRLDGTLVKKIRMDIAQLGWVTDDFLYYFTVDKKLKDVLWKIPIKKTEQGDQLQTDRKEKLLKATSVDVIYGTDEFLMLEIYKGNKEPKQYDVSRYDCKTGELVGLMTEEEGISVLWGREYPFMWGGKLLFYHEAEQFLAALVPQTGEIFSIYSQKELDFEMPYAFTGDDLYFFSDDDLYRLRCSEKEMERLISGKEFLKAVRKLKPGKETGCEVRGLYLDQDRLYFRTYMEYSEKDKASGDKVIYQKEGLFRVSIDDFGTIIYEDKLMDYLDQKGKYEINEKKSGLRGYFTSVLEDCGKGKYVASYGEEASKRRYVLYDLQTGEIEDMTKDQIPKEYRLLSV